MTYYEQIVDAFTKWGIKGAIITILSILSLMMLKSETVGTFLGKIFDKIIKKAFGGKKKEEVLIKETDISKHEIFNYIDFWVYSSIPTLVFKTDYRTVVFRKYLSIYFRQYSESLTYYISSTKYKDYSNLELKGSMFNLLNDIVRDYEREMNSVGLPEVVINKMKTKNNETLHLTLELINSVCDSPFYNTDRNLLKVFTILNILLSTLEYTISISDDICNSINGELKGKSFDGRTEP